MDFTADNGLKTRQVARYGGGYYFQNSSKLGDTGVRYRNVFAPDRVASYRDPLSETLNDHERLFKAKKQIPENFHPLWIMRHFQNCRSKM